MPLRSSDPQSLASAQDFFALAEQQAGTPVVKPNDGTYDLVHALLVVGTHIAKDTLFAHRM